MVNPFIESEGFTDCSKWFATNNPGDMECDTFNSRIKIFASRPSTLANDGVARDMTDASALGTPISDTAWRLRLRLHWPITNSFRNTGALFDTFNRIGVVLSDSDQNTGLRASTGPEKAIGLQISNFDGNDPTPAIRAGGAPVPPNGFRALLTGLVKDGTTATGTPQFTPGGQPGSLSTTHIQIERINATMIITLFVDSTWTTMIEQHMVTIPPAVIGLKYLKFNHFEIVSDDPSFIDGHVTQYELLNGPSFTPIMPLFPNGLAAKIFNDLGVNGPSTGDEVFARIFDDGVFPETWSRIREKNMYGFLENMTLIQRDIDKVTWDITTWSVI